MTEDQDKSQKWYFKFRILVVALLVGGPLALPLLWWNPRISSKNKFFWTLAIFLLTAFSFKVTAKSIEALRQYYGLLSQI